MWNCVMGQRSCIDTYWLKTAADCSYPTVNQIVVILGLFLINYRPSCKTGLLYFAVYFTLTSNLYESILFIITFSNVLYINETFQSLETLDWRNRWSVVLFSHWVVTVGGMGRAPCICCGEKISILRAESARWQVSSDWWIKVEASRRLYVGRHF